MECAIGLIVGGALQIQLLLLLLLLVADTSIKFRKDPFRGVDGIAWKKATFAKQMPSPTAVAMAAANNCHQWLSDSLNVNFDL